MDKVWQGYNIFLHHLFDSQWTINWKLGPSVNLSIFHWSLNRNGISRRMAVKKLFLIKGNREEKAKVRKITQKLLWKSVAIGFTEWWMINMKWLKLLLVSTAIRRAVQRWVSTTCKTRCRLCYYLGIQSVVSGSKLMEL